MLKEMKSNWRQQIPACFGVVDLIIGAHPNDEERTRQMIDDATNSGATTDEIIVEIQAFLATNNANSQHIQEQIERVKKFIP